MSTPNSSAPMSSLPPSRTVALVHCPWRSAVSSSVVWTLSGPIGSVPFVPVTVKDPGCLDSVKEQSTKEKEMPSASFLQLLFLLSLFFADFFFSASHPTNAHSLRNSPNYLLRSITPCLSLCPHPPLPLPFLSS